MEKKVRNPKPEGERINLKKIEEALQNGFILTKHARERMGERSFSVVDIEYILKNPKKLDRHDTSQDKPTCSVIGSKINGEWGAVAISINRFKQIVILTLMDRD